MKKEATENRGTQLMDMAAAARFLDISRQRVYYLVMDGQLQRIKIKNKNYFKLETLTTYKKQRT